MWGGWVVGRLDGLFGGWLGFSHALTHCTQSPLLGFLVFCGGNVLSRSARQVLTFNLFEGHDNDNDNDSWQHNLTLLTK